MATYICEVWRLEKSQFYMPAPCWIYMPRGAEKDQMAKDLMLTIYHQILYPHISITNIENLDFMCLCNDKKERFVKLLITIAFQKGCKHHIYRITDIICQKEQLHFVLDYYLCYKLIYNKYHIIKQSLTQLWIKP